jgi:putative spermidine/putrescine transport system permease protein
MASSRHAARWSWLGLVPFLVFVAAFELAPVVLLLQSSFSVDGTPALGNFGRAMTPGILESFRNSLELSLATAGIGAVLGTIVAYAIITSPRAAVRHTLTALSDVTANFGGAPLAFAFIITLGSTGFVTLLLQKVGIEIYPAFRIYSITGLALAYLYFQMPLAILLTIPGLLGLKREWREAATSLGATNRQYWLRVAFPILAPAVLATFFLLFANAFGAYATAWTLTGSDVNLVTVQIAALVLGEVQLDPGLANALAVLSLAVMGVCLVAYQQLAKRYARTQ